MIDRTPGILAAMKYLGGKKNYRLRYDRDGARLEQWVLVGYDYKDWVLIARVPRVRPHD